MIPSSITYEHVIKALNQIDEEDIPEERKSTKYDLLYQEKRYPPKLVISKANIYACGKELNASKFSGGKETNNYLLGLGFEIVRRESVKLNPDWVRDELILALNLYFNYPEKKKFF